MDDSFAEQHELQIQTDGFNLHLKQFTVFFFTFCIFSQL